MVQVCTGSTQQTWRLVNGSSNTFDIVGTVVNPVSIVSNPQWVPGVNVTVFVQGGYSSTNPSVPAPWSWGASGELITTPSLSPTSMCLALAHGSLVSSTLVWLEPCTGSVTQSWVLGANGALRSAADPSLCIDSGSSSKPCAAAPWSAMPFCDATLPLDARLDDMLSRMTQAEQIQQLASNSAGAASIGLGVWSTSDFTHSAGEPLAQTYPYSGSGNTVYPAASAMGQAFNRSLWSAVGDRVGAEARALYNAGYGALWGWSPNINIARDPRWGRINEVTGEDPYLMGEYAAVYVAAQQWGPAGAPNDTAGVPLRLANTCKHFAGYSLELWNGTIRYDFNAIIPIRDLVGTYLPAFQACVEGAKVASLMCSYNAINGTPACAEGTLMNEIARGVWGFDGAITSDCGAAKAVWQTYGFVATAEDVCPVVLNAGMDTACSNDLLPLQCADAAIADGILDASAVRTAARRVLSVRLRTGQFDGSSPWDSLNNDTLICAPDGLALAVEAAAQSLVLAKVNRSALPLRRGASLAVVGPNANATFQLLGDYSAWPCHGVVMSVVEGLSAAGHNVTFEYGMSINSSDTSGFAAAAAAAAAADATVVVVGLDLTLEREGHDRYSIGWPGAQGAFVADVCAAAAGPCIVALLGGGPVDISDALANPAVDAVFLLAYPGMGGASAFASALVGDAVPAGRTTKTFYPAEYVDQVSMFEFSMPAGPSAWPCCIGCDGPCARTPGRTHRFYTGTPVLPFGFGLSYTTFEYALSGPSRVSLDASRAYIAANEHPKFGASFAPLRSASAATFYTIVNNTGSFDADDVVLAFLLPPGGGNGTSIPLQSLFAFERVHVPANTSVTVPFVVTARDLTQVLDDGSRAALPGNWTLRVGVSTLHSQGSGFAEIAFIAA